MTRTSKHLRIRREKILQSKWSVPVKLKSQDPERRGCSFIDPEISVDSGSYRDFERLIHECHVPKRMLSDLILRQEIFFAIHGARSVFSYSLDAGKTELRCSGSGLFNGLRYIRI